MPRYILHRCLRLPTVGAVTTAVAATAAAAASAPDRYRGPLHWVAGGRLIAFASHDRLWTVRPDGSGRRRIGSSFGASLSPSGRMIAYSGEDVNGGLLIVGATGSKHMRRIRIWNKPVEGYGPPVWAPDERAVAVDVGGRPNFLILVVDLRGRVRRISRVPARDDTSAAWSPDGRMIAFETCWWTGRLSPRRCGLALVRRDGTARRLIVRGADPASPGFEPVWSPDGSMLAYTRPFGSQVDLPDRARGRPVGVYVVRRDGSGRRRVASTRPVDWYAFPSPPAWSPDGRRLAFADNTGISAVDLTNGRRFRLTFNGAANAIGTFAWAPGSRVVFPHDGRIYTVRPGAPPRPVTRY